MRRGRMTRRRAPQCAAVLACLIISVSVPRPVAAQTAVGEASIHALSIGDATLTELVFPVGVTWRVAGVRLDANTAFASARYERAGVASSIAGLTDITLRVVIPMLEDRGRIIVAGNVPTGTAALSDDQIPVAGVITTDLLTLPVRSFGTGAGVTTGVAVAQPVGGWVVGGILVYRVGSAFEPVVGTAGTQAAEFRPGSELRLRLGFERPSVSGVTVRGAISWSRFAADQTNDQPVFARGDRLMAQAVTEFPFLRGAASVYAWNLYRFESELMLDATPQPTPASNLLGAGAAVSHPLTPELTIRPRAELLVQTGEPGFGAGDGWITRLGSAATYLLGPVRLEPAVLLQLGALEGQTVFGLVLRGGAMWRR